MHGHVSALWTHGACCDEYKYFAAPYEVMLLAAESAALPQKRTDMGQLSKAERDLLEKLMKAREGRDPSLKSSKVGMEAQMSCPRLCVAVRCRADVLQAFCMRAVIMGSSAGSHQAGRRSQEGQVQEGTRCQAAGQGPGRSVWVGVFQQKL